MYLLFNKDGTLNTAIPHGDVPRQGGDLILELFFPYEMSGLVTSSIFVRFKNTDMVSPLTSCEKIALSNSFKTGNDDIKLEIKRFQRINETENIFGFHEGVDYQHATVRYRYVEGTNCPTRMFGNTEFYIQIISKDNSAVTSKFNVHINETYGLSSDATLGMTFNEYNSLKDSIVDLVKNWNINKVGFLNVGEYDSETGEIEFVYDSDIVTGLKYNEDTGVLTIEY